MTAFNSRECLSQHGKTKRDRCLLVFLGIIIICMPLVPKVCTAQQGGEKRSAIVVVVDDLRPEMLAYGRNGTAQTPALNRLAKRSLVFDRAYAQVAVCAPSRTSFMTGRRPDSLRVWNFHDDFRHSTPVGEQMIPLPEWFKERGYLTLGAGKTYHPNLPRNYDNPRSWTSNQDPDVQGMAKQSSYLPFVKQNCPNKIHRYCGMSDDKARDIFDNSVVDFVIDGMRAAQSANRSFFIAAGFRQPHTPWMYPQKYADELDLPTQHSTPYPVGAPTYAFAGAGGFSWENGSIQVNNATLPYTGHQMLSDSATTEMRTAYFAAVRFVDSAIGRVLHELETLGLSNTTAVVFVSDHGYHLGDQNTWTKHTNFELGTRVPFMVSVPWLPRTMGYRTREFVELVDVFPTLVDLMGSAEDTMPDADLAVPLDGKSLVPLLEQGTINPGTGFVDSPLSNSVSMDYALSQYPRCAPLKHDGSDNSGRVSGVSSRNVESVSVQRTTTEVATLCVGALLFIVMWPCSCLALPFRRAVHATCLDPDIDNVQGNQEPGALIEQRGLLVRVFRDTSSLSVQPQVAAARTYCKRCLLTRRRVWAIVFVLAVVVVLQVWVVMQPTKPNSSSSFNQVAERVVGEPRSANNGQLIRLTEERMVSANQAWQQPIACMEPKEWSFPLANVTGLWTECHSQSPETFTHMGYSLRTKGFRYTAWLAWDRQIWEPLWDQIVDEELYVQFQDADCCSIESDASFEEYDRVNVAHDEQYATDLIRLRSKLLEVTREKWNPGSFSSETECS